MEAFARGLTVLTFVLMCWVVHRTVQVRTDCVNSAFISVVMVDGGKVYNCRFESRLNLRPLYAPLSYATQAKIRRLESAEELASVFHAPSPRLAVEIVTESPQFFELGRKYLRLGQGWIDNPAQVRRAMIMAVLNTEAPAAYPNEFELEVMADFLSLSMFPLHSWSTSLIRDVQFPTTAPSFDQYCKSPMRSLAHARNCGDSLQGSEDLHGRVWGFRALLATALWRVYDKSSLPEKIEALRRLRTGSQLPLVFAPYDDSSATLAVWFTQALKDHLDALGLNKNIMALKRTLKELQVEAPTHWELTVDVTKTPAWHEIVEQLRIRSRLRPKERILVFTPEGAVALPSGFPVQWAANDISTQKHVMIACNWPSPDEAIPVKARRHFAQHSCDKLTRAFWD
jgi:hypothetical protein